MLQKDYQPRAVEEFWYQRWEESGYFTPQGAGASYCIVIPPPNVTGSLHMGHSFQMSLMDALIRYHRMLGNRTLWQLGTDHAGIAAQMIVENLVLSEGKSRQELGRENFVQRVWDWKNYSGNSIAQQERRLGISGDWSRERFTLDPGLNVAVEKVFIELYQEGLIYRGKRLVNWDPVLKTAISDLEVINEEHEGSLWYVNYLVVDSGEQLTIATTRPETILGDTALAVHPDDPRYLHLIGKLARVPLTDRVVPIIADSYVDREFGTGCLKITPAHDFNDYAVGQRHQLPMINIFTPEARLNDQVPQDYRGLDRFVARERIVQDLAQIGQLVKIEKHQLKIPKGDRSGSVIEPYLTDQWFLRMRELAQPALEAVRSGKIKFIPEGWDRTYFQWLENIEDWCISRQLWWGHRIPAWSDESGTFYVGTSEEEVRAKYALGDRPLKQDEDVLDTWFSAALWPMSALGWPEATPEFQNFFPTAVLVTGFDIIFFWVARMIMFSLKFTGEVPFHEVYITGLIRDRAGQKMSKSKGNVLDPIDLADGIALERLVEKRTSHLMQEHLKQKITQDTCREFPEGIPAFGIDALRFTFCALATTSRDINFDMTRLEGYRNFCTKIWNAARYTLMQTENWDSTKTGVGEYSWADRWIMAEFRNTLAVVAREFSQYRFDLVTQALYEFTWYQFCDWYLELVKPVLISDNFTQEQRRGAKITLVTVLEGLLRALHPFMPFITEEIWQHLAKRMGIVAPTIMLQQYPDASLFSEDPNAMAEMVWLKGVILAIRNIRGEVNIAPNKPLTLWCRGGELGDRERIIRHQLHLKGLGKLALIEWIEDQRPIPPAASALVGSLELYLLIDADDLAAERVRLQKAHSKVLQEISRLEQKLANKGYVQKAPATVVNQDRVVLQEQRELLTGLAQRLARAGNSG